MNYFFWLFWVFYHLPFHSVVIIIFNSWTKDDPDACLFTVWLKRFIWHVIVIAIRRLVVTISRKSILNSCAKPHFSRLSFLQILAHFAIFQFCSLRRNQGPRASSVRILYRVSNRKLLNSYQPKVTDRSPGITPNLEAVTQLYRAIHKTWKGKENFGMAR